VETYPVTSQSSSEAFPLRVGSRVTLRPVGNKEKTGLATRILGFDEGRMLIFKTPKPLEEFEEMIENDLLCFSFHDGALYSFITRVRHRFDQVKLVLLDYPNMFQKKRIRAYQRIRLQLDATFRIHEESLDRLADLESLRGIICQGVVTDISEGGCRLLLYNSGCLPVQVLCTMDFRLPDGQDVEELEGEMIQCTEVDEHCSEMGILFRGPSGQLRKVMKFCRLAEAILFSRE